MKKEYLANFPCVTCKHVEGRHGTHMSEPVCWECWDGQRVIDLSTKSRITGQRIAHKFVIDTLAYMERQYDKKVL